MSPRSPSYNSAKAMERNHWERSSLTPFASADFLWSIPITVLPLMPVLKGRGPNEDADTIVKVASGFPNSVVVFDGRLPLKTEL